MASRHKGDTDGEARTMVLVNKHIPACSNIPQGICVDMKNDFLICLF
jgi:hypothetical protein